MAEIAAKDVKRLRDATGAGMMDAKRALTENDGDFEEATKWLRERGLGKAAERAANANSQGAVAVAVTPDGKAAALVELKSETDFTAKSPAFVSLVGALAKAAAAEGEGALAARKDAVDDLKVTLKENIDLGPVVRFEAGPDSVLETYVHLQNGRGVNGVLIEVAGAEGPEAHELAHDLAVHVAFGRPSYLTRDEVPEDAVAAERAAVEAQTRLEGKSEAALPKIVEGKLNGWYKRVPGSARLVRFAQAVIGD
jgi:elongation factor Ts